MHRALQPPTPSSGNHVRAQEWRGAMRTWGPSPRERTESRVGGSPFEGLPCHRVQWGPARPHLQGMGPFLYLISTVCACSPGLSLQEPPTLSGLCGGRRRASARSWLRTLVSSGSHTPLGRGLSIALTCVRFYVQTGTGSHRALGKTPALHKGDPGSTLELRARRKSGAPPLGMATRWGGERAGGVRAASRPGLAPPLRRTLTAAAWAPRRASRHGAS